MFNFFSKRRCNNCWNMTDKKFLIPDIGYDDWGYQCIVCAEQTGLLEKCTASKRKEVEILKKRLEYGIS